MLAGYVQRERPIDVPLPQERRVMVDKVESEFGDVLTGNVHEALRCLHIVGFHGDLVVLEEFEDNGDVVHTSSSVRGGRRCQVCMCACMCVQDSSARGGGRCQVCMCVRMYVQDSSAGCAGQLCKERGKVSGVCICMCVQDLDSSMEN